jgi:putative DNA primase/helicase
MRFELTDAGNATRFNHLFGDRTLYSEHSGWWVFTGKVWERSDAAVLNFATQTVDSIEGESIGLPDEESSAVRKWYKASQGAGRIEAIPRIARSFKNAWAAENSFNPDSHLLNCQNGILDLDTGLLQTHDPKFRMTAITSAPFAAGAECPRWRKFMDEITDSNPGLVKSLQQIAGYAASGFSSERCLFILYGMGANGKSIFLDTLSMILGSYAASAPSQIIMARTFQSNSNDIAMLHDRRFVATSETESNHRLAEQPVKHLTGDTEISARFLYGEFFTFPVHFKIFLATNHKPAVANTDKAIWDRLRLLPFTVTIPTEMQTPRHELLQTFAQEGPGILNWILDGYGLWRAQDSHLQLCQEIQEVTDQYREDQDTLGAFIQECLVTSENAFLPKTDLYSTYRAWIESQGQRPLAHRSMRASMLDRGFREKRTNYARGWEGIALSHEGSTLRSASDSKNRNWQDRDDKEPY